jgi:hypothetical protein
MKKKMGIALMVAAASLAGCQSNPPSTDGQSKAYITQSEHGGALSGRWSSSINSFASGRLEIDIEPGKGALLEGSLLFSNSSCPWEKPFTGTISDVDDIVIKVDLGGKCGHLVIQGAYDGKVLKGTYKADYPDSGVVTLQ